MEFCVEWIESLPTGTVHYIAEYYNERVWKFFERDGYDIRWYGLPATPELIAKATRLHLARNKTEGKELEHPFVVHGGNVSTVTVDKPWGHETLFGVTSRIALKRVSLMPDQSLSRQVHFQKDELYLVIDGEGRLELGRRGEIVHELGEGDVVHLPPGVVHRLVAGNDGIVIIEASTPELTDIVRLDDRYGRGVNDNFDPARYEKVLHY